MRLSLYVLSACGILIAAAVAHGWRTDRWGAAVDLKAAAARLQTLPLQVGDWDGVNLEMSPEEAAAANIAGSLGRRYTHRYSRAEVSVVLLCGRPGPIAVHPPEVCYGTAGFTAGPSQAEPLEIGHTAWTADFSRSTPREETLRIRWAWSDGGNWTASKHPRTDYLESRILYKLYVIRSLPAKKDAATTPELDLIKVLLPQLQTMLSQ